MVYITAWDEFVERSVQLYRADPHKTRYVMKYRHCDGKLVLKVTDDKECLKFKTDQAQDAKKMEKLNSIFFTLMTRGPEEMSAYDNVVGGKLKLKGKALDVKAPGMKKKKKKQKKEYDQISQVTENELSTDGGNVSVDDPTKEENTDVTITTGEGNAGRWDDNLTPAERRYIEQREQIDKHKMAKTANKSHRDRIEDFNQYLANMSEHYDIPKVGPG